MYSETFIEDIRRKAKSNDSQDQYLALLFALQIPSICSRIELPQTDENTGRNKNDRNVLWKENGDACDKNLYFAWLRLHKNCFMPWYVTLMPFDELCNAIYKLRNQVTHTGSLRELDSNIVLVESCANMLFTGKTLYLSVQNFCETMFDAAKSVFRTPNPWYDHSSLADAGINLQSLSQSDYDSIQSLLTAKYQAFWDNHDDGDLKLYQDYCFYLLGNLDEIEQRLKNDSSWSIGGLTRGQSERLVEVVHEVNIFGDDLDNKIAEKYFTKKL